MSHTVGSWEMILGTKCWQAGLVMLAEGALAVRRPEKEPLGAEQQKQLISCGY